MTAASASAKTPRAASGTRPVVSGTPAGPPPGGFDRRLAADAAAAPGAGACCQHRAASATDARRIINWTRGSLCHGLESSDRAGKTASSLLGYRRRSRRSTSKAVPRWHELELGQAEGTRGVDRSAGGRHQADLVMPSKARRRSLDIIIFRFDLKPVEKAIEAAVERGVAVRALIAHTNSRRREAAAAARTAHARGGRHGQPHRRRSGALSRQDDDRRPRRAARLRLQLHGARPQEPQLRRRRRRTASVVQEALRLFEADVAAPGIRARRSTTASSSAPRTRASSWRRSSSARRSQLVIYDPKLSRPADDPAAAPARRRPASTSASSARSASAAATCACRRCPGERLHVRAMVRDGDTAFVGSQSLRALELDARREVGLIVRDAKVVKGMLERLRAGLGEDRDLGQKEIKQLEKAEKRADGRACASAVLTRTVPARAMPWCRLLQRPPLWLNGVARCPTTAAHRLSGMRLHHARAQPAPPVARGRHRLQLRQPRRGAGPRSCCRQLRRRRQLRRLRGGDRRSRASTRSSSPCRRGFIST